MKNKQRQWRVVVVLYDDGILDTQQKQFMSAEFITGAFLDIPLDGGINIAVESVKPLSFLRKVRYFLFGGPKKAINVAQL